MESASTIFIHELRCIEKVSGWLRSLVRFLDA